MSTTVHKLRDERGFTLIELLIVMIILGILMAIAIPTFLGQKGKALGTEAKATARLAQQTMEACAANDIYGRYTNCTLAQLQLEEPTLNDPNVSGRLAVAPTADGYTVNFDAQPFDGSTVTYTITKGAGGAVTRTCAPAEPKMCATGTW